jgi:hypothetical protein
MKILRLAIAVAVVFGGVSAFATGARVESMGKSTTFIMDDMSIFDNPANINLYPNFLIGELGTYVKNVDVGRNEDPDNPWFGGIFSLNLSADFSVSIAGVLNRKNERLLKYLPNKIEVSDRANKIIDAPDPVTNFDGFLGANYNNKAFGVHIYVAHQDGLSGDSVITGDAFASAVQLDFGTNIEISQDYAFEFAIGGARIQYGPSDRNLFDVDLFSLFAHTRLFSKAALINGHIIPVASIYKMNAPGRDEFEFALGIGADAAFDRGFFWIGLLGFYNKERAGSNWYRDEDGDAVYYADKDSDWGTGDIPNLWQVGGIISFGIERNIWWDWFVLRVGGQKTVAYADYTASSTEQHPSILCPSDPVTGCQNSGNYFVTNPVNNGTNGDHVGFGFGINIEEKLKIDFTVAEDLMFRNPFQGEGRLISRVSATYSF